jgi:thymidylate synthase
MARSLGVELGTYKHAVGSLHLYEDDRQKAEEFVAEGWQSTVLMPPMPFGSPWPAIKKVLKAESAIRRGVFDGRELQIGTYWDDIVRLLQIYGLSKHGDEKQISRIRRTMSSPVYEPYIERRRQKAARQRAVPTPPVQEELFANEDLSSAK